MYIVKDVLTADELGWIRNLIKRSRFVDGAASAGGMARAVKHNEQLECRKEDARQLSEVVFGGLNRSVEFQRYSLPHFVCEPFINRYAENMEYGAHYDTTFMPLAQGTKIRSDLSITLFVSEPESYDGGELCFSSAGTDARIKLKAGSLVIYPASTLHRVAPVTRGERLAIIFWVQSVVRDHEKRNLIIGLDEAIARLAERMPACDELRDLTGLESNLMRMWADV